MSFLKKKSLTNEKKINFLQGKKVIIPLVVMTILATSTEVYAETLTRQEEDAMKTIDDVLFKVQLICAGICVGLATLMGMIAGFFRIVGLREEAKKRFSDAITGMIMVLSAPVVIGIIATIVRGLLSLFPQSHA